MKKVIAYVGTKDLDAILETDILKIDVINKPKIPYQIVLRCFYQF